MTDPNEPQATPAAENGGELSDDELEPVAGGARPAKPIAKTPAPGGPVDSLSQLRDPGVSAGRPHRHVTGSRISTAAVHRIAATRLQTR
jgi:hypothetical protein